VNTTELFLNKEQFSSTRGTAFIADRLFLVNGGTVLIDDGSVQVIGGVDLFFLHGAKGTNLVGSGRNCFCS
jgi:hypothetical protein